MKLLLIALLPFLGATLAPLAERVWGRLAAAVAAGMATLASAALLLSEAPRLFAGEVLYAGWTWLPAAGLTLSFRLDGFAFLFAFLILAIGALIIVYARYYLTARDPMGRFYFMLMLFMGAMLGIVTAGNLILMVVFWELTSLSSFLLIGYWSHQADSRQGARMAIAVTGGGGLLLLAGVLLLGQVAGSYELADVLAAGERVRASPLYVPILLLVLAGAFTKSAQFPLHFWLPHAMAAPTPVSAYLHSATMVKAGIFLLGRLFPVLAGTPEWFALVTGFGLVTLVFAAFVAFFKHDMKALLAYSTVSHLGLVTALFGFGTPAAAVVAVLHIMNHAAFKAPLFMTAGIVDHEAGTRDMRALGGLRRYMPMMATLAVVASAAMAGVPFFNGFLSKEMFFAEAVALADSRSWLLPAAALLGGTLSAAYSVRFAHAVFFGRAPASFAHEPHEPPFGMKAPVLLLVALCVLVGVLPQTVAGPLLALAAGAVVGGELPDYSLALWHGFNLPLAMSAVALAAGALIYVARAPVFRWRERWLDRVQAKTVFDLVIGALVGAARHVTAGLQNDSLQRYLVLLVAAALAVGAVPFWQHGAARGPQPLTPADGVSLVVWGLLVVAAVGTAVGHRQRLQAVVLAGVVGLVVALAFLRLSGPDLAMTQLSVEVVTIVLMLLALYYLPQRTPRESALGRKLRDAALAAGAGGGAAALVWLILTRPLESIAQFHLEQSVPGGGGTNVVNVILVDFRGYDTLGEITVLGIAALGIYLLLDGLRAVPVAQPRAGGQWIPERHPLMLVTVTRALLPITLLVAAYIMLRGHNQPGGGFIAGLVVSVALIMHYIASGISWTTERLRTDYQTVIALGLLVAVLTGVGSWFFGRPFLTSAFGHFHLPVIGEFELATAVLFDLGVFLTVIGAVMLILAELGNLGYPDRLPRPRERRAPAAAEGGPAPVGVVRLKESFDGSPGR